jgi:putative endonuclease
MYYVYAIYNKAVNKFYIGQTEDLEFRLVVHNQKLLKGYTSRFDGNWKLIYSEKCQSRKEALIREKQLKTYRGRQFIKTFIPG